MRLNTLIFAIPALAGITSAAAIPPKETGITYSSFQSAVDFLYGFERAAQAFLDTIKDSVSEVLSRPEAKSDLRIEVDRRLNDLKETKSQTIEQPEHPLSNITSSDSCKTIWDNLSPKAIVAAIILDKVGQIVGPNGNNTSDYLVENLDYFDDGVRRLSFNNVTPLAPGVREQCFKGLVKTIDQAARSALEKLGEVVKGRSA